MNCDYVREYYNVPAKIGLVCFYNGKRGIIYKDGGAYIAVNFDSDKPGDCKLVHPEDPNLVYSGEMAKPRKMTQSQKHYQDWLHSDSGLTFSEYMGMDKDTIEYRKLHKEVK